MKKKGIGYSSTFYGTGYGNGFPDESRATAKIESNGTINIYVEVSDVGSGGKSVMWQIATKTLNIDEKLVKVINTNTNNTNETVNSTSNSKMKNKPKINKQSIINSNTIKTNIINPTNNNIVQT